MSTKDDLVYVPPVQPKLCRRVYALPVDLVKLIHSYGHDHGHQSEVSAVRELLTAALTAAHARAARDRAGAS